MVIKILAWDYSGSTANMAHYHTHGAEYLRKFSIEELIPGEDERIYLRWDDYCEKVSLDELELICKNKYGRNGTDPSTIVQWIIHKALCQNSKQAIELWLITDGEIGREELVKCAQLNQQVNYSKINFIVINKSKINMSVGASFFRGAELKVFHDDKLMKTINTSVPYKYDTINLTNFENEWDQLSDFIQAKFMGSDLDSLAEVDKLTALRKRLLEALTKDCTKDQGESMNNPTFSSKKKTDILNVLKSCNFYKTLVTPAVKDFASKIDGSISTLINYIHNKHKSLEFNSLKMEFKENKIPVAPEEPEPEINSLDDAEVCNFYDAVTFDNEQGAPILLLTITDLIEKYWVNGKYSKFRTIMDCPFFAKIDECIGHVYLIETFQSLCENNYGNLTNPMTNQPVWGGIIFSESADRWNDFILLKTFFRGKKVNTNIALWYYVIYKHAENKEWIEPSVQQQLKNYAYRRLANAQVKLGFSNLPLDPKEIVPLPIACFFCTEGSSLLFGEDPTLFLQERLRMFVSVAKYMLEILDHFEYNDVDKQFVEKRAKVFEILTNLKHIPQIIEKRYFLLQNIFETKDQVLTYKLKDENALKYFNLLDYHHKTSMIPFDYDKKVVDFRPFVIVTYEYKNKVDVKISPDTFRPYFIVSTTDQNELITYYNELITCISNANLSIDGKIQSMSPVKKINYRKLISSHKCYIDLTKILGKFPTYEEYSAYTFKVKRLNEGKFIRLFDPNVIHQIKTIFDQYAKLNIGIDEFIKKTQGSTHIEARIEMEKRLKFYGNDINIKKFISDARLILEKSDKEGKGRE